MDYTNIYALADKLGDTVHHHIWIAACLMLLGGILSSLSPSSVPRMVAIVNYAGREATSPWAAVRLSLAFVAGICTVYCGVGAFAGSFGALLTLTSFLYYFTAALCLLMGLSMIRLIELKWKVPQLTTLGHGLVGAYALGFGFAFLIAPDATPFMLAALAVTTFQGQLALGASLMLAFGLGHGIPVVFAGALAPWYTHHAAVRKWHIAAEMAAGYVLVFLALFFAVIA
ncbi:MAG: sulfite exporter TauE/SafE family protein [Candidatus Eremiobacteraeota bacterium]|nr:sulfite exporter TauE/SafE family protein [Candidatus Eremiobacteraeota bacterium]MBC5828008.1 sulfite exporter TauE/SafE family protein [Candidatus Eremiobacteraeota bacterium]